jgi:hypothetical protein
LVQQVEALTTDIHHRTTDSGLVHEMVMKDMLLVAATEAQPAIDLALAHEIAMAVTEIEWVVVTDLAPAHEDLVN